MRITVMTLQECRKDKMTTQTSVKREEKERSQRTMCNSIKKQSMQLWQRLSQRMRTMFETMNSTWVIMKI